jgi:heptosyltransferase-2
MRRVVDPSRTLVIQTAFLGDVVLTVPLLHALRSSGIVSHLTLAVAPRGADVARDLVDAVVVIDKDGTHRGWRGMLDSAELLRRGSHTVALLPHRSLRSALLARVAGVPSRIGYAGAEGSLLYTERIPRRAAIHEADRILDLARGLNITGSSSVFPRSVRRSGGVPTVVLSPGSRWATKRWTIEGFAKVAAACADCGWHVVVTGAKDDAAVCRDVVRLSRRASIVDLAGALTLNELSSLFHDADVVVSNDSASVHIADAEGTPSVVVFGPTVPEFGFFPRAPRSGVVETTGLVCRPCGDHGGDMCPVRTHACMRDVAPEDVMAEVERIVTLAYAPLPVA